MIKVGYLAFSFFLCILRLLDDFRGYFHGAENSNTSEGRRNNSSSSPGRSSSSPSKGTSASAGGAPVLKVKGAFTTSIASKFGGTSPGFPKPPAPTGAPRRDSKDLITPRRDSVGPRRDSIGTVSLKKFENNSSSTSVEFTAIKLKKVSKVSSSSVQEEKTKTTAVKTASSVSEESADERKSEDVKTKTNDSRSVIESGRKIDASVSSKSSSTNDVSETKKDEKLRLESKSFDESKKAPLSSSGKTEPRVRHIPVEREVENGNTTGSRKRDKSLDTKDCSDATISKLTSMSVTSKVKVKKKVTDSPDQVPCLKLSSKTPTVETVSGSVSNSTSVTTSSSSSSRTITSESSTFATSNSLCRSATIKSTEIPLIAFQTDAVQEAKLSSTGKKTKKLSDGSVKKKKIKPKGEVIEIPIILESAAESVDVVENSVKAKEKKVADHSPDKIKKKKISSNVINDKSGLQSDHNEVEKGTHRTDNCAKVDTPSINECNMTSSKKDLNSASMTESTEKSAGQTPTSRTSLESQPDVLKRSLPGEVAFSPAHAQSDGRASCSSTGRAETLADTDSRNRSAQSSSPSASVSSVSNISSPVCSVIASSSPVCSLSAASSSSQSVCSLSNATDTLSTSISTSASDLSVSPPPTVTLPLTSSMVTSATAADASTSFATVTTSPSSASTTTTSVPPSSTNIPGEPAIIIVRDMSSIAANINRTTIKAPASSTIGALFAEVGHKFGYEPDSFSLSLQSSYVTDPLERLSPWLTLEDAGFQIDGVSRNSLLLMDLRNGQPKRTDASGASARDDDLALGASASPSSCGGEDSGMYSSSSTATKDLDSSSSYSARSKRLPADIEATHEYTSYSSTSSLSSKHDTGYVGLVNQAMTCYLNSLLQTLFMTPEFRNALYRWEFRGSKEEASKSIPYQLQKLFLLLQTADRSAIETTSLTRSFGWDSSEAWQQHDIQELCRVMFEALEQSFANTDQANLIDTLYQGKMKDYVKCLACGNDNARMDSFLDIPLPIRPFGSSTAYQSLEEALRAFVAPELLDGNNQYQCSKCNAMCDAHKGLKFTKYPYLLTIHLKRFDFDYQTFHRIKLNDRVTFPNVLDLSEFLDEEDETVVGTKVSSSSTKSDSAVSALDDSATDDSGSALDTEDSSVDFTLSHNCDDDEGIELSASDTEKSSLPGGLKTGAAKGVTSKADLNGPRALSVQSPGEETSVDSASKCESGNSDVYTNYQLFSIMIHSGSASGGHYYAYIRDFLSGDWFCFNDQSVTRIGDEEIKKTYGGGGRSGSSYGASANAYMLMYRQCNEERNVLPFAKDNFPTHIQKLCENLVVEEELEKEAREREKCTCVIKLFCQHTSAVQLSDLKLRVHKDTTLAEATKKAHELLDLHKSVPLERCRLVKYEEYHDSIESSFEDQDDKPMSEVLGGVKSSYKFDLLMEVRDEHQQFESYQPGGVSFKVFIVSLTGQGEVDGPVITRGLLSMTVADLKKAIATSLNLNSETMRIASEGFYEEMKFLSDDAALLRAEGFYKSNKLFVEASGEESANFYVGSQMASIIERYHNTITLYCTLPVVTPAILEELNIPPHVEDRPTPALANSSVQATCTPYGDAPSAPPAADVCSTANLSDDEDGGDVSGGPYSALSSDQSTSEDSSLTSDSDRTLVGDPPDDDRLSEGNNSPDYHNVSSPEENNGTAKVEAGACGWSASGGSCWSSEEAGARGWWNEEDSPVRRYFKAQVMPEEGENRVLQIRVDKRMTVDQLKLELQPYVSVAVQHFKLYKKYIQEFECSRGGEQLNFGDSCKLVAKLDRALQVGEYRGKVYLLDLANSEEPAKFLIEFVLRENDTVGQAKAAIVAEIEARLGLKLRVEDVRLRRKSWKNPQSVYLDRQIFCERDIALHNNWELYLHERKGTEPKVCEDDLVLFVRRWRPSLYQLEPLEEIVLTIQTAEALREKLGELSGVSAENIEFARGTGPFPHDVSVLDITTTLTWNSGEGPLDDRPYNVLYDGVLLYYRDKEEPLGVLTDSERSEVEAAENKRLNRDPPFTATAAPSKPAREKGLKIYFNND